MKSSSLIIATLLFFIVSALAIAFVVDRDLDPDYQKDWWAIRLTDPFGETANFTIDNHSSSESFQYAIEQKGRPISTESFTVKKGESLSVFPDVPTLPAPPFSVRIWEEGSPQKDQSLTRK